MVGEVFEPTLLLLHDNGDPSKFRFVGVREEDKFVELLYREKYIHEFIRNYSIDMSA